MSRSIEKLLAEFQRGTINKNELVQHLRGISDISFAQVDLARKERTGQAECIFGENKTAEQIIAISSVLYKNKQPVLVTRISSQKAEKICASLTYLTYDHLGKTLSWLPQSSPKTTHRVGVICAGTSDLFVANECITTLTVNGHIPSLHIDIGVAGLHRLLHSLPALQKYDILIVIAGMEGALPSVIAGLCPQPIIAVPTSVGYGSHQNGMTTLHAMLCSCASGITVVNIDNGYGAACAAARFLDKL